MRDRYASVHLEVDPGQATISQAREVDPRPFDILLFGDFSARGSRSETTPRARAPRPVRIDRDDFDAVVARMSPLLRLALEPGAPPLEIAIGELDDFHPDALHDHVQIFARLRELRRTAIDPDTFPAVAAELASADSPPAEPAAPVPSPPQGGVLDLILAETSPAPADLSAAAVLTRGDLSPLVRRLVRPHLIPRPDSRQTEVVAALDAALSDAMRQILHHPEFQRIEGLWRGVHLLVRELETGSHLRVHLVDVSDAEMDAMLLTEPRALLPDRDEEQTTSRVIPALLVVLRSVCGSEQDLARLRGWAEIARDANAPCLIGAAAALLRPTGDGESATLDAAGDSPEGWLELRRSAVAPWLGLASPRFLLRAPYGEDTDEIDRFPFEEVGSEPTNDQYLWGEPALVCALLLGHAFAQEGWEMRPGRHRELHGLPIPLERRDGEIVTRQSTEAVFPEAMADAALDRGIMPLVPIRDRGAIRVVRFQSIAEPAAPLAGAWRAT